jgi:hypothetical protein
MNIYYLFFDRLAKPFSSNPEPNRGMEPAPAE